MILVCFVRAFLYKRKKRLLSVDNKRLSNCELSHEDLLYFCAILHICIIYSKYQPFIYILSFAILLY